MARSWQSAPAFIHCAPFDLRVWFASQDRCVNAPQTNNVVVVNAGACSSGCGGTTVNMHTFAFDKIAAIKYGNVQIRIRQVRNQGLCKELVLMKLGSLHPLISWPCG